MSTSVKMPAPRNLAEEGRETLETQIQLAPDLFAARASEEYGDPAYQRLQMRMLNESLFGDGTTPGILDLYGRAATRTGETESATNTQRRLADVADIEAMGPRIQSALRSANPEQYALLDQLSAEASAAGPTALETRLREQALADLELGGQLTPEQERMAIQDARQAFNDRGMLRGNAAMSAEVLNRFTARDSREQQRRQFAGQVAGLERQGMGMDRGFRAQTVGMWGATQADPVMAITGRQSLAPNAAMMQQGSAGSMYGQTGQYFNPFSGYAGDLYNTNYNAAVNAAITNANNSTAVTGAAIGAAGSMAGGFMCWVAREAYGDKSGRLMRFRHLLVTRLPVPLRDAYRTGGRQLAKAMKADPALKRQVTRWLDRILAAHPILEVN